MKRALACLALCLWSSVSSAYPFRCDRDQNRCEVQTKRMTVGDKVGVFNDDKELVGLGEVIEMDGTRRVIQITKKWVPLLRSHEIEVIPDEAYAAPENAYKIVTPLASIVWAAQLGIVDLGVGDGFIATEVSGLLFKRWFRSYSYYGRLSFLTGKGQASDNLGGATNQDVSVSDISLSGGISQLLLAFNTIAVRMDGEAGVGFANVKVGGGFDEKKVLNNRVHDGAGVYARLAASAVYRRDGIQPEIGLGVLQLHNSTSPVLTIGLNGAIK